MKNEYAESYIYEVLRRIPKSKRKKAKLELEKKIVDMCKYDERKMMETLSKLGDPAEYAKRYNKNNSRIIGSEYMESYIAVLKSAITCFVIVSGVFACLKAASVLNVSAYKETEAYLNFFITFFMLLFEYVIYACIITAFVVTVIYIIAQHQLNRKKVSKPWIPENLKPVKDLKKKVDVSVCLTQMVISCIIAGALIICPGLWGVYASDASGTTQFISLLNQDCRYAIIGITMGITLTVIVENSIELASGYYTKIVILTTFLISIVRLVLIVALLALVPLLNNDFVQEFYSIRPDIFTNGVENTEHFYKETLPWILMALAVVQWISKIGPKLKKSNV